MDKTDLTLRNFASLAQKAECRSTFCLKRKNSTIRPDTHPSAGRFSCRHPKRGAEKAGSIELGGGMAEKLVLAFCDSPYLNAANYEQTLHELFECFYAFKNETSDVLSDKTLLIFMRNAFDHVCGGSTEQLSGTVLPDLARHLNLGGTLRSYLAEHADDFSPEEEA